MGDGKEKESGELRTKKRKKKSGPSFQTGHKYILVVEPSAFYWQKLFPFGLETV